MDMKTVKNVNVLKEKLPNPEVCDTEIWEICFPYTTESKRKKIQRIEKKEEKKTNNYLKFITM